MDFIKANFPITDVFKILEFYPFKSDDIKVSELQGVPNNNYRVIGKDIDIVIKVYSHGQSDESKVRKELEVINIFGQKGLKVPKLISGTNNQILQKYNRFNVVAANFISGTSFDCLEFTEQRMLEVGRIVARVETEAKLIDISAFESMNFTEEFNYVSKNVIEVMNKKHFIYDLETYDKNLDLAKSIINKLDNTPIKQFLHKDIWPWNLIESKDGIYLLDFNDWTIGDPIIELSVAFLEFGMFKSDKFNTFIAKSIIEGYKSIKNLSYTPAELWESVLFICFLFFHHNVIQSDDKFDSEIYLKRIDTLLKNPKIFTYLF
jgi:Ser/Thr protein kinase RdoA (MazF antagonist)